MSPLWVVNLVAYSLQVAALVAAAALLVAALRVTTPRVRLAIWQALLAVSLVLPFLQPWRPAPVPGPGADLSAEVEAGFSRPSVRLPAKSRGPGKAAPTPSAQAATANAWLPALGFALAAGAALRLAWLGLGLVRLARYRRDMTVLDPVPAPLADAFERAGARATIGVAEGLPGPVTFGARRPLVLLPPAVLALDPALQTSVVCHELLHVRRRDWIWSVSEELLCALAWFHPAIWWLASQIDLAREQHVDAEVVRLTGQRKPYLEALLYLASPDRGADLAPAPALLRRRHLARRLLVLAREVSMSRQRIVLSVFVLIGLLSLTAGAAAVSFPLVGPASADPAVAVPAIAAPAAPIAAPQTPTPVRVGGSILPPKKVKDVRPVYPPEAHEARIQGVVILEATIGPEGRVTDVKVLRSVPELDQAALDAVRQWEFAPTLLNGVAVPVMMAITVNFTLADKAKAEGKVERVGVPGGVVGGGVEKPQPPKRIYYVAPVYPEQARAQKVQGVVILEVTIGPVGGIATDVKVLRGIDLLNQAAIDAVRQWRWTPPSMPMTATLTVRFTLDDETEVVARANLAGAKLEAVKEVKPRFPPEAREAKLQGTVEVEIVVDKSGLVSSARVLKGADAFHQAALDAARQWQFTPPASSVKTTVEFTFTLK